MATAAGSVETFERTTLGNGVRLLKAPMANVQSTSCFLMFAAVVHGPGVSPWRRCAGTALRLTLTDTCGFFLLRVW